MSVYLPTCNVGMLQKLENQCKIRLAADPANLEVRLDLAWCLFMQALHEAGRESLLRLPAAIYPQEKCESPDASNRAADQNAFRLLKGCLHETFTVLHISPTCPQEVAKLHYLVRLAGADQAMFEAEDEAIQILERLSTDISRISEAGDITA